ncbi:MAG: hypothetical protein IKS29_07995 [Oscillospiraceae bacterium]|nr:hypothetical protein [Oscillospiraceae bacterium]
MKTTSILLQTLCVPCACRCRYCLLSWDGMCVGADYERSEAYARRFYAWLRENRPDLKFSFSFGYSMEHPKLFEALPFLQETDSPTGRFLQCDGMAFREGAELTDFLQALRAAGVESLNFTFYGLEAYHDRFAARPGDFAHMLKMLAEAKKLGFSVSAGIPLNKENASQAEALAALLTSKGAEVRLIVPHGEGRGRFLEPIRFSLAEYEQLSPALREQLNRSVYRPEGEWVRERAFRQTPNRLLILSLTTENIDWFEVSPFDAVISHAEALDEAYYAAIPSLEELTGHYGNPDGQGFFQQRDLFHFYQRRFLQETGRSLYDVTDERQTGSRRY